MNSRFWTRALATVLREDREKENPKGYEIKILLKALLTISAFERMIIHVIEARQTLSINVTVFLPLFGPCHDD